LLIDEMKAIKKITETINTRKVDEITLIQITAMIEALCSALIREEERKSYFA